ncbi:MAG: hypothetical protein H7239_03210 [Flavobacterium sp.]|nr:hypothetical protein [Flavobacterium sp.]
MNRILWIVNDLNVEEYIHQSIVSTLISFPLVIIEVFVEKISFTTKFDKTLQFIKPLDIRFKSYKKSPFEKTNLSKIENTNLVFVLKKDSLSIYDYIIFSNNKKNDYSFYENKAKIGLLQFDYDKEKIINYKLSVKRSIPIIFSLKLKASSDWKFISNMTINLETGLVNSIEKYFWFQKLSFIKFLNNPNEFEIVKNRKYEVNFHSIRIIAYYKRLVVTIIKRKINKPEKNWKIALKEESKGYLFLNQPEHSFWADPFLISRDNKHFVFFEELNKTTNLGEIACVQLDESFNIELKKTIFKDDTHFSFPNVFYHNDGFYMLPENSEKNSLSLYKATLFPFEWSFHKTIIDNCKLVDAVWVYHNEYYWLFANKVEDYEYDNNDALYLYYSKNLDSNQWLSHKQNPICTDSSRSRGAGAIFKKNGKLFRPAQNCSKFYGANIVLNEIIELSIENYEEEYNKAIFPAPEYHGIHTINSQFGIEIFDFLKVE